MEEYKKPTINWWAFHVLRSGRCSFPATTRVALLASAATEHPGETKPEAQQRQGTRFRHGEGLVCICPPTKLVLVSAASAPMPSQLVGRVHAVVFAPN